MDVASSEPVSRLRWYPLRGFELDLNAHVGDVSLMLVAVPLPADGTVELRAGSLDLDKLEILFKAQVDVDGAPGQLTEASVRFVRSGTTEKIELSCEVEDAETGDTREVKVVADVIVPSDAPESGGPRPKPAEESELDWEDDDTFEAFFKDPLTQEDPLPVAERESDDDGDFSDELPRRPAAAKPSADESKVAGFDRLLKALMTPSVSDDADGDLDDDLDDDGPDGPSDDDPPSRGGLKVLPGGGPPSSSFDIGGDTLYDDGPTMASDPADARGLLTFLLDKEELELEEGHDIEELVAGAAPILSAPRGAESRAAALSSWLFDQPAVAELYIDDESLAELIEQW